MNHPIAVITTFPTYSWEIYSRSMLVSFVANWPNQIPILIKLDDDSLVDMLDPFLRPTDAVAIGHDKDHADFVARNKDKDKADNYRHQPIRFCHKVFALKYALGTINRMREAKEAVPRFLIWMDADVVTNRKVTFDDLKLCLPKEGDAVAYMGRKDWPHSECGWLAFDLENGGDVAIEKFVSHYLDDSVLSMKQNDDSWVFDQIDVKKTNLTPDAKGMDVWPQSPMGKWSTHYKGPVAKANLGRPLMESKSIGNRGNVVIQTRNAIPHEDLRKNIEENQKLITNWIRPCILHDEELIMVSAGPSLIAEELRKEKGKRIVAVKHALEPLKNAGIKPWSCILLDPRPHVNDFVKSPDKDIIWFIASQVEPSVTKKLLDNGCTVWGYHASVNAGEEELTKKQPYAVVAGGTATATRGLFVLNHLGFKKFKLYGYDLCIYDKPDMNERDKDNQPKYLEISIGFNDRSVNNKRCFWTKPELIAQFEELNDLIKNERFEFEAFGDGMIPFVIKSKKLADLRNKEIMAKMIGKRITYEELLKCQTLCNKWHKWLPKIPRKLILANKY